MRRITSPPYCYLETVKPVRHKRYNKQFKLVEVNKRYRFDEWYCAKDLAELITLAKHDIKSHGWKCDPKKGTVNGIPMRRIPSNTYQNENFSAVELKAPPGYGYWKCDPEAKTVTLLGMFDFDIARLKKNRKLWKRITSDARYLPPLTVPMPDGWVITHTQEQQRDKTIKLIPQISSFLDDRARPLKPTFEQAFSKLSGLMDGTVDWRIEDAFGWPSQDELVPLVFSRKSPGIKKDAKFWQITGKMFDDKSPKVLYRAMHYFGATKLDELYKGNLVRVYHPQGIAWCDIGTWKCWMDIRLYANKDKCEQVKPASCIQLGQPHESDTVKAPSAIRDWYDLLVKLLETKTMIYSGNDFEV